MLIRILIPSSLVKVLVLGSNGILGKTLCPFLRSSGHQIHTYSSYKNSEGVYIDDFCKLVESTIKEHNIESIINLIAITDLELCENNISKAYKSNIQIVEKLKKFLEDQKIHFLHISTDQVYSGSGPHKEDKVLPLNVYGLSKYLSEIFAEKYNSTVLRINYVGKSKVKYRQSLSDWLYKSFNQQKKIFLYNDIFFSPLFILDLCKVINFILLNPRKGTFNLGSNGFISKAEFGMFFAKGLGFSLENAKVVSYKDINQRVKRPLDMSLDITKFQNSFDYKLPTINETISNLIDDYKNIMQ